MTHFTSLMYYLPTKPSITAQYLKGGPEYAVFAKETETARGADGHAAQDRDEDHPPDADAGEEQDAAGIRRILGRAR